MRSTFSQHWQLQETNEQTGSRWAAIRDSSFHRHAIDFLSTDQSFSCWFMQKRHLRWKQMKISNVFPNGSSTVVSLFLPLVFESQRIPKYPSIFDWNWNNYWSLVHNQLHECLLLVIETAESYWEGVKKRRVINCSLKLDNRQTDDELMR